MRLGPRLCIFQIRDDRMNGRDPFRDMVFFFSIYCPRRKETFEGLHLSLPATQGPEPQHVALPSPRLFIPMTLVRRWGETCKAEPGAPGPLRDSGYTPCIIRPA